MYHVSLGLKNVTGNCMLAICVVLPRRRRHDDRHRIFVRFGHSFLNFFRLLSSHHIHPAIAIVLSISAPQLQSGNTNMSFSSRRRNYLLTPHRRDGLIEW
jgi:hypothetical protein